MSEDEKASGVTSEEPPVSEQTAPQEQSDADPSSDATGEQEKSGIPKPLLYLLGIAVILCAGSVGYRYYGRLQQKKYEAEAKAAHDAADWHLLEQAGVNWSYWEPDSAMPWIYAAEGASRRGDAKRTALYLYHLPNSDPASVPGLLQLSHVQFEVMNLPIAGARTCERILSIDPGHGDAHARLLYYFAMTRQRDRLIAEANRAIALGSDLPSTHLYLVSVDWLAFVNGGEVNRLWLQSSPDNPTLYTAAAFHELYTAYMADDQTEGSEALNQKRIRAQELLDQFPEHPEVLSYHLEIACYRADENRAIELLAKAPPSTQNDSRFWRYKGFVHQLRDEESEAEQAYLHALDLYPYDYQAQHQLAAIYRKQQAFEKVEQYERASVAGKELRRQILQSPNTTDISVDLIKTIAEYVRLCGQEEIADRLVERIAGEN